MQPSKKGVAYTNEQHIITSAAIAFISSSVYATFTRWRYANWSIEWQAAQTCL